MKFSKPAFFLYLFALYLVATGISFAGFKYYLSQTVAQLTSPAGREEQTSQEGRTPLFNVDPTTPRTEVCPLNGEKYTKAEREAWEKRRPMTVMIENHLDSRPQSGLSTADVIYEAVAEGGITRFMAVYYCNAISADTTIGPVRSARTYFLDWASEYSKFPIYVHVGGGNTPNKANALGQINDYGWGGENDLNQFGLSVKECWRDYSRLGRTVATEHTMYCSTEALWKVAANRGWTATGEDKKSWTATFTPWKFEDPKAVDTPSATTISFDFWKDYSQYTVKWTYDSATNLYLRETGGAAHVDRNSNKQLSTRVIITQFVKETGPIDDHMHMLYGTIGTGKAVVYQNGEAIPATWTKKDRLARTIFTDAKNKEIKFAAGRIWIEELSTTATVTAK